MSRRFPLSSAVPALLLFALFGCGGTEPETTPSISMLLSNATPSIAQGANATITVTVNRVNYTGNVALSLIGAPTGVTGTFSPATLSTSTSTSTLTLAVAPTAATGSANLTVQATGTNVDTRTASLALSVTAAPNYSIAPAPASLTVAQGGSGTSTLTITRTGGFTGTVSFAASGLPSGVTASFNPTSVSANSTVLTVTAASNATAGTHNINVVSSATGIADKTTVIPLTVTAAGNFSLAASPSTMSVNRGASGATTVNITRTGGFSGAVSLAASGLPSGVTASFNPASATGNSSTLTLSAGSTAAIGTTSITITGSSSGLANQTTTVSLTVAEGSNTSNMSIDFCAGETPIWFAFKNEGGSWTRVTPTSGGTFNFQVTPKFSVAFTRDEDGTGDDIETEIYHVTADDLEGINGQTCGEESGNKTLNGSVSGLGTEESAGISMAFASAFVSPGQGSSFQLFNVPTGQLDLVATRHSSSFRGTHGIIRRGVSYPDGGTIPVLNFGSTEPFALATANVTTSGVGSDQGGVGVFFFTGRNTFHFVDFLDATASPSAYFGMPSSQLIAGDMHILFAYAENSTQDRSRIAQTFFRTVADKSLALGPALSTPTYSTLATTPYLRMRAVFASQPEYGGFAFVEFDQNRRGMSVGVSSGFLGGTPTNWDLSIPDFTGVEGWQNTWGLQPGEDPDRYATAQSAMQLGVLGSEGTTYRAADHYSSPRITSPYRARLQAMRRGQAPFAPQRLGGGRLFRR